MAITPDIDDFEGEFFDNDVCLKVFGVGGGGGNSLDYMVREGINEVEYIAVNTDAKALRDKDGAKMKRLQIGKELTRGRGAGNKPEIGAKSAEESRDLIKERLKGATMVFIAAGMGGGTGTGAAPIIASIAREMGILTVGVVTKPFEFEQVEKMNQALKGIEEMRKYVDSLVIIPNQKLLEMQKQKIPMQQAFKLVDEILYKAVKSIAELVTQSGYINVDFADVEETLKDSGIAHMAIGVGSGENKIEDALNDVINSPLLETSIAGAGRILVNISMYNDATLDEIQEAMQSITKYAMPSVKVISGMSFDETLEDTIVITVIATSFVENSKAPTVQEYETEEIITESGNGLDHLIKNNKNFDDDDDFTPFIKIFGDKNNQH